MASANQDEPAGGSVRAPASAEAPSPAQPGPAPSVANDAQGVRTVRCEIHGSAVMPKDAVIWDAAHGGTAIASFAGQPVGIAAYEVATQSGGRAKIRTSGGVEVEGWIVAAELPVFASDQVPVVAGHVWIGRGQPLVLAFAVAGTPEQLLVDARLDGQVVQTFRVAAPCSALTLDRIDRPGWDVPGTGRGYVPRRRQLDLYGEPGGTSVLTVHPREAETSMLMFSTETRAGFVHVIFHDEIVVDAWARETDLIALKPGETMDLPARPARATGAARLSVSGSPPIVRVARDTQIRLTPQSSSRPVGGVAPGTELFVIDTVLGWSSVLPRALNLLPPTGRSFWVRATEIGGSPTGSAPR
jgi:hypothetical protein